MVLKLGFLWYNKKMEEKKQKFFTERDKTLFKLFLLVFFASVLVINWKDVSGFLNLRTAPYLIGQKISNLLPERREASEEDFIDEEDEKEEETAPVIYCEEDRITIPAIDITAPVVETGGTTEEEYRESLDRGVTHFPGSSYPGEKGLSVLLGHSAPPGWPKIKHDWVFTNINDLEEGDEIEVCYNNRLTTYYVTDDEEGKRIYEVGEDVPPLYPGEEKKEVVLMSCWPPGSRDSRIGVRGIVE